MFGHQISGGGSRMVFSGAYLGRCVPIFKDNPEGYCRTYFRLMYHLFFQELALDIVIGQFQAHR